MFSGPVPAGSRDGLGPPRCAARTSFRSPTPSDDDGYRLGNPVRRALVDIAGARSYLAVPIRARHVILLGSFTMLSPGSPSLRIGLDRAVAELRDTGRDRHRERAAVQRDAGSAGAADRDGRILKVIASSPSDVQPVFEAIADQRRTGWSAALSTTVYRFVDGMIHLAAFTPTNPEADATLRATFPAPLSQFSMV